MNQLIFACLQDAILGLSVAATVELLPVYVHYLDLVG
jgi:hypothetical protein